MTPSRAKILVTGSLAFDHIMDFPSSFEENILPEKIKALSVSFLVTNFSKNFGGVAGNIAYNLALLGQRATILSCAGKRDSRSYLQHLRRVGVETGLIEQVKEEFTANMFLITDRNNCQIAGFYPGAMREDENLSLKSVRQNRNRFAFMIVAPTVPGAMIRFLREAKKLSLPYLFDPAQQIPRLSGVQLKEGIEGAEILVGNDYELALIARKTGFSKKQILKRVKILVTTLGEKGSWIETPKRKALVGIVKPKQIIDPTGAGDGYIAGFLAAYLRGYPLKICGQIGATAATYVIEHYGTQKHSFTSEQFQNRYRKAFGGKVAL